MKIHSPFQTVEENNIWRVFRVLISIFHTWTFSYLFKKKTAIRAKFPNSAFSAHNTTYEVLSIKYKIFSPFVFHFGIYRFYDGKRTKCSWFLCKQKNSYITKWAHIAFHLCIEYALLSQRVVVYIIYCNRKRCGSKKIFQIKERIVSHVKYTFTIVWTLNTEMDVSKGQTAQSSSFNNNDNDERWRIETFRIFIFKIQHTIQI